MVANSPSRSPGTQGDLGCTVSLGFDVMFNMFEQAWQTDTPPNLDDYARRLLLRNRGELLHDLVHVDLEYRLKRGEEVRLEQYLERFPELRSDTEVLLELAVWEFRLRCRQNPGLGIDEYLGRLPVPDAVLRERLIGEASEQDTLTLPATPAGKVSPAESPPGFQLQGELGRGGMGVVYRARQIGLGRQVALKMILGQAGASESARLRFLREARAVAQLKHPGIVPIYTIGEHAGQPFFAMELVAGGSLASKLDGTPWEPRRAAELARALAAAVQHAHERGIIHRDLKPANVLLDEFGVPQVTDFGLARVSRTPGKSSTNSRSTDATCVGSVMGTPAYMAPEQAAGRLDEMGPATDVFGLGAILYHLLTGRPPYNEKSLESTLAEAARCKPIPIRRLNPRIPAALVRICEKAMAADAADRYASAGALFQALTAFLHRSRRFLYGLLAAGISAGLLAAGWVGAVSTWSRPGVDESPTVWLGQEPLHGHLALKVSAPGDPDRQRLDLDRPGALPVRTGDALQLRIALTRPAYVYLVWLGSQGERELLYPGKRDGSLDVLPDQEPRDHISSPEDEHDGWPIEGEGGLETVLLFAREQPLPAELRLAELIGEVPLEPTCDKNDLIVAGANQGRVALTPLGKRSARGNKAVKIQERTRQLLARLAPHFDVIRAIRFAHKP